MKRSMVVKMKLFEKEENEEQNWMYRLDGEMRCLRMFHVNGTLSESLAIYKSPV